MDSLVPVFDLDGTLLDSDAALIAPFLALGVPRDDITFGHTLADECDRFGFAVDDYVAHYDLEMAQPFDGSHELIDSLDRWAVCSNKLEAAGTAELSRLGWRPELALFAEAFGGAGKTLGPVLAAMGLTAAQTIFVGDTLHDRRCATEVGCRFAWAGWNPRAEPTPGDEVLATPTDLLELLAG